MFFDRLAVLSGSLKVRITVGFIASLVLAVGLTTLVLVNRAEHDTLQEQTRRELSESVRSARLLSRQVVELQRALSAVASQLDAATLADDAALARFIHDRPVLRGLFSSVFVSTPIGQLRVLADERGVRATTINIADRDYFKRSLAERRPVISPPLASRVNGELVVILTQPIYESGAIRALLCGALRVASRDLLANVVDAQESDEQALTVVTDALGTVLAHPDRARLTQSLADEPRMAAAFAAWVTAGSPVEPAGLQLQQTGELVSAAGVAGPDWMVWRARPEGELLAPLRSARQLALMWAAGLLTLMSAIILLLVSWLLRPLRRLEDRAEHMFDGVMPADQGWPEVSGEIGRLSSVLKAVNVERAQLEASELELLRRLGSVMSAAPIGIAFTRNQRFELVSAELCSLYGRAEAGFLDAGVEIIFASADDYTRITADVLQAFQAGHAYVGECQMARADGSRFWARLRGRPVDSADPPAGTIWTVNDISEQRLAREELAWTAGHDPLTGLANRRAFERRAAALVQGLPVTQPAAIIFVDLDYFKPVNDQGGHAAGDAMLVAVAAAISSAVRATDLVARPGGDEFAVLLERCSGAAALHTAEHIRAAVAAVALPWGGRVFSVSASLGVASLNADTAKLSDWLARADAACYAAKSAGRGQVHADTAT